MTGTGDVAWLPFLAASGVLAATPGPGVIFIMTKTLSQGRASGLWSLAGVALGNLGNAVAASLGLAALLAASATAFLVLQVVGAAYLLWLGVQALRRPPPVVAGPGEAAGAAAVLSHGQTFRDACVVALFNPKTALFFAAFLPQFIVRQGGAAQPALLQVLALGAVFVAMAACTDLCYVLLAARLWRRLKGRAGGVQGLGRYLSAAVYVSLGLYALMARPAGAGLHGR